MSIFRKKKLDTFGVHKSVLQKVKVLSPDAPGEISLYGRPFFFHHAEGFLHSYNEIIKNEIYRFSTDATRPLILDCGANMGLSVLYFSKRFPGAKIIAFEPDESVFSVLKRNTESHELTNVQVEKKAVWDAEAQLHFTTDRGLGGSAINAYANQKPVTVEAVRLADYLTANVDLLKLDVEGAEYRILLDCEPRLANVQRVFVEYHSFRDQEQRLEEVLALLKRAGFRYHLKDSFVRLRPFIDRQLSNENMDMAVNVFAYRDE